MMTPIPITYLITELDLGGAQSVLYRLLSQLDRQKYAPVVICLYNGDRSAAQLIRQLGFPVYDLRMSVPWRFDVLWRLYKLLRQERPFLLHCWMFHANLLGRVVGRLARVPVIITARRNVEIGGPRRELIKRYTRNLDDAVIAVCELARQVEIERTAVDPAKVITIYNGIDLLSSISDMMPDKLRSDLAIPPGSPVVICVSRLHPQKGHDDLLAAWQQVTAVYPRAYLLIVGDGERRLELEEMVAKRPLLSQVRFSGQRTDIPDLLALSSLFVLPSLWEGLPNVILEAMAAELPVVATAVGGTPELVIDGVTGRLVPPRDATALAEAVLSLLRDPGQAAQMGRNGRQRVIDQFSLDKMVAQTEALYETLLEEKMRLHYVTGQGWQPL